METNLEPSAPGYDEPRPVVPQPKPTPAPIPPVNNPPVPVPTTPAPKCSKCLRNINGMCKKILADCAVNETLVMNNFKWDPVDIKDCAQRDFDEVKVCSLDCDKKYRAGTCESAIKPVCAYSIKSRLCKKFANFCLFKRDACRYPTIMDWRVTYYLACKDLKIGGPAGTCMPII
ncbi:uncharacterized protein ACRADG_006677 isoform 2-T2 [Cochliomyia hominivorax]